MREIKFKYYFEDKKTHKLRSMIIGIHTLEISSHLGFTKIAVTDWLRARCQYTGQQDKNSKEIYEGDIMFSLGVPLVVEFDNGGFIARNDQDVAFNFNWKDMEIAGNIYENGELLEKRA